MGARPFLAILPHVFEKKVAERDVREAAGHGMRHRRAHPCFVDLIRTRRRNVDADQGDVRRVRLRLDERPPDGVHRDSVRHRVERRQKARDLDASLPKLMQSPRRVFP